MRLHFLLLVACNAGWAHAANLIFSANDQQSGYSQSGMFVVPGPKPGSLTAVDFSAQPPQTATKSDLPCSVVGPPACVAASQAGRTILVAGAMQVDPNSPDKLVPDRRVTLLQWTLQGLEQKDQAEIGQQPSGIALSPDGARAFVTLRAEGKIAVLDLRGGKIRVEKTVAVSRPEDSLSHIALSPDGRTFLATLHDQGKVLALNSDLEIMQELVVGKGPYDLGFLPGGAHAFVACTGANAIYPLASRGGTWSIGQPVSVDRIPESLDISADGTWLMAGCLEPAYTRGPVDVEDGQPGRLRLFQIGPDAALTPSQSLDIAGIPQAAVFTADSRRIVAGDYGHGKLVVYELRGSQWEDTKQPIEVSGQPAALAAAPEP